LFKPRPSEAGMRGTCLRGMRLISMRDVRLCQTLRCVRRWHEQGGVDKVQPTEWWARVIDGW